VLTRVANLPSRAEMQRPQLKADLAENLLRTYDALWRRARATHSALVDTTWRQLARACGYPEDTRTDRGHRSIARYLDLLAEAGMVTWGGAKTPTGRWQCLHVELLEPPSLVSTEGRSSSAGQAAFACEARRRHESPRDRAARRRSPWRRCGGRRDAVARHDLSWSKNVRSPYSETACSGRRPSQAVVSDGHTRSRQEDASGAEPRRAPAQWNGGDEEERDRRRQARRERRRRARVERLRLETRRMIRDGDLVPRWERERYAAIAGNAEAELELFGSFAGFLATIPTGDSP
jgi:hypothetical protein